MAKQEITLKGLDGHEDHLVYDAANGQMNGSLEDCARSLFPAEGETTPRLRFQGFEGEWERVTFGDIFKYERPDNYIVKSEEYGEDFPTPVLTANKGFILGYTDEKRTFNQNCVIFDDFTLDCKYVDFPFMVKSSAMKILTIKDEKKYDLYFAYCLLKSAKIEILGHARHYISVVQPTTVLVPSLEEQKAISSFFHRLDSQITLRKQQYEQLEQIKTACLSTMFPKQNENTPPIRFSGHKNWTTMRFVELFGFLKNNSLSRAELGTMGKVRNVHYGDILIKFGEIIDVSKDELPYIKDEVIAKSLSEDCLLQNSDVIFADAAEDNTVGKCAEIISINDEFVVSGLHTIPCRPSIGFSKGYLGYCLNANSFHDQLLPLIQGTKISSISKKALLSTTVSFPTDMEEQKQITSFLYNIDIQIQAEQQRLDKLKQMKSACLRSMFPQNGGGNLPLIRFKGFNREWKYFNFETLFSIVNDSKSNVPTNQYKTVGKYPIIDQSKDFIVGFTNNNNPIVPSSGYIIFGDHTREFKYVDFPFYTGADGTQILRCKQDDVVPIFAYYLCLSLTIPNTGYNRHLKYVKESRFPIPPSIEEQERIASFFRSLDTKISLQTQRIEKLKQLKTACLSRMIA